MTLLIMRFTVGQLIRQRRMLLLVLLAALPVALAILFRVTGGTPDDAPDFASIILAHLIASLVLPLTALVVGSATLGQELEDGTITYLIAKRIPRWQVVLGKAGAAWVVTSGLVLLPVAAAGLVILAGHEEITLIPAFAAAVVLGALAYSAVFVSLSVRFNRALIIGLAYVFVWETLVSQFVPGVRLFSIRAYTLSIAEALGDTSGLLSPPLSPSVTLLLTAALTALATWYSIRRLQRYEMSERV